MDRGNRRLQYLIVSAVSTTAVTIGVSFSWATPVLPKFASNEVGFTISDAEVSWMVAISSIGYMTGSCISRFTSDRCGRRFTLLASSLPNIVGAVLLVFAWEAWMLSIGRFLWGCGAGLVGAVLEEQLTGMNSHVRTEMIRSDSVKEFITGKQYRRAIIIVIGLKTMQLMSGLHAIQNYLGPLVLESNSEINITLTLIIFGTVRFILGIISSLLVDRLGRRPLLIFSFFGTGLLFAGVAAYFAIHDPASGAANYPYNLIPFLCIIFALTISMLGYESVCYLIPAELFPMNVKAIAMTTTNITGGVMSFVSVKTYQPLKDLLGLSGVFVTFSLFSLIGSVFSYFLVIETKGKSLREIQVFLQGNRYVEEEKLYKAGDNVQEGLKTENQTVA